MQGPYQFYIFHYMTLSLFQNI